MGMPPINQPLTYYNLTPFLTRFQLYPGIDLLLGEENRVSLEIPQPATRKLQT